MSTYTPPSAVIGPHQTPHQLSHRQRSYPDMHPSSSSDTDIYAAASSSSQEKQRLTPVHTEPDGLDADENRDRRTGTGNGNGNGIGSSGTAGSRYYRRYFASGAHKKNLQKAPFITWPVKGTEEIWIEPEQEAVEWLSLFYDLVVVAVLTIFSTQHELANPAAIPIFLSFFVIIFWVWVSQTAYDMRYQGNDALNRFFKFLQIGLFIYQGAASGNWNPGRIEVYTDDEDTFGARMTQHQDALQSFTTVAVAFAVSRAVLALQYIICMFQARRARRQITHIGITVIVLLASMTLAVISFCLPSTSRSWKIAKLVLFYSGIFVEVGDVFVAVILKVNTPVETHKVAERYGAFTLIILGEGIISVTRAFSRAISGLSEDDSGTYVQVFLTILTLFLLYSFLFGTFDKNDHTGQGRAILWQIVHFPLCFGILLLVAAMVNVVVTLSATHGLTLVLELLEPYSEILNANNATSLNPVSLKETSMVMNKLSVEPPFAQGMGEIFQYANQTSPDYDPQIIYAQYVAQIVYSTFQKYGVEIPVEATNMYYTLYGLNDTWIADVTERTHLRAEAAHMFVELTQEIINDAFTGVLWLLPVAGCVLILSACRSMLWYRFIGPAHWVYHGSQIIAGICLGLLGLLDIGNKHLDITTIAEQGDQRVAPLYEVIFHEIPLVIIAMVYLAVYVGSGAAVWYVQRRRDKREAERRRKEDTEGEGAVRDDNDTSEGEGGLEVELDDLEERR